MFSYRVLLLYMSLQNVSKSSAFITTVQTLIMSVQNNNKHPEIFFAPIKTLIVNKEWICSNVPCAFYDKTETTTSIKPFNKSRIIAVDNKLIDKCFVILNHDEKYVYTDVYPGGKIDKNEFGITPININGLVNEYKNNKNENFKNLLSKIIQDSYNSKGNNACINMSKYNEYMDTNQSTKLERVGDPIFNRASRHTPPISSHYTRAEYETCDSFPAPIGIRAEDFAWPSEQNELLREQIRQLYSTINAPQLPEKYKDIIDIQIIPNSHCCDWCGEKMDLTNSNQSYCSKEHSVNFCHRDPKLGTTAKNIYIGHCNCNREQGGYSEEQRILQIIRLAKHNPNYRKMILDDLS